MVCNHKLWSYFGTGTSVKGKGVCKDAVLKVGDLSIAESFLALQLNGVEVVLGMQWLFTLGVTEVDWRGLVTSEDG